MLKLTMRFFRRFISSNYLFILIVLISGLVFLTNLGGQYYSLDEPETVILGKTILKQGLPLAWDGKNLISGTNGLDSSFMLGKYVWKWHPWFQHYLAAVSVFFFGDSVAGSRFLFALFGVGSILVVYKIAKTIFEKKIVAFLISFQLIFLLPFFLYMRQVRYYAPATFFSLVILVLLLTYLKREWSLREKVFFGLSTFLLFMTNYVLWFSTILIIFPVLLFFKKKDKKIFFVLAAEIIFAGIWFVIFKPYGGNVMVSNSIHGSIINNFKTYMSYINGFIFPLLLIPWVFFLIRNSKKLIYFFLILFWVVIKLIIDTTFLDPHGRYLVDLFPVFIILYGFIYLFLLNKRKIFLLVIIFLLFSTTNLLHINTIKNVLAKNYSIPSWTINYKTELTGQYPNMIPEVGKYLNGKAESGNLYWSNNYRWYLYNESGVPSISPLCDLKKQKFTGPVSVSNPDNIRWFIFFQHDKRLPQALDTISCFGKNWQKKIEESYTKKILPLSSLSYTVNDPDIVNRQYPPVKTAKDQVIIYEKN